MRIIGFEERGHVTLKDGSFFYNNSNSVRRSLGYSLILIGSSFFHRAYMEMYFDPNFVPTEIISFIDKVFNCDDMWFNIMASKFLSDVGWNQPAGLKVHPIGKVENMEREACKHNHL